MESHQSPPITVARTIWVQVVLAETCAPGGLVSELLEAFTLGVSDLSWHLGLGYYISQYTAPGGKGLEGKVRGPFLFICICCLGTQELRGGCMCRGLWGRLKTPDPGAQTLWGVMELAKARRGSCLEQ